MDSQVNYLQVFTTIAFKYEWMVFLWHEQVLTNLNDARDVRDCQTQIFGCTPKAVNMFNSVDYFQNCIENHYVCKNDMAIGCWGPIKKRLQIANKHIN